MYIAFNMVRHFIFKPKHVTCSQTLHKTLVDFAIAHFIFDDIVLIDV